MSSISQVTDYADLFCELFDGLPEAEFRARGERWLGDPAVVEASRETERAALEGTLSAGGVRGHLESTPGEARPQRRFAVLGGLDAALGHANPLTARAAPETLAEYALRYAETGRLDSGAVPGGLLPRFARPGRRGQLPEDLGDAFGSVVRVQPDAWSACAHVTIPAHARLTPRDRLAGLRVATTPMIRDPEELRWEVKERAGLRFYRIHPADHEPTRERIEHVIAEWDAFDASIGVAPELCLSPYLLERWQAALGGRAGAPGASLRLVLAGSGNVERADPPANAALLLDALTGEVLVRQHKIHPFNLSPADVELWGLDDRFEAPIDEDLTRGERLSIIEAGNVRMAILVCEDLARLHAFSSAIHAHGVSLILVPVFARPTKDRRWERAKAEIYSDATGSSVVVANSLVIAEVLGIEGVAGTSLAVAPGKVAVGHAADPGEVVVFAIDGGLPSVEHESAQGSA
jgi:predicted amidohydrolase